MWFRSKTFVSLLILGLLIRFLTAFWSFQFRENTDILRYRDWGKIAYLHSIADTYKETYLSFGTLPNNQPPGSVYIITAMYHINIFAAKIYIRLAGSSEQVLSFLSGSFQNFFLRLPQIFSDIAIAVFIYIIVGKYAKKASSALLSASLFLFNPVIIYNSSFWGQMDSLNTFLFFFSLILLIKKRIAVSILFFFFSLYVKVSLIYFLPLIAYLAYLISARKLRPIFLGFGISLFTLFVFTLPISKTPVSWLFNFYRINGTGEMENITAFAFNFWWLLFRPFIQIGVPHNLFSFSEIRLINSPSSSAAFLGIPLMFWGILLFLLTLLPVIIRCKILKAKKINSTNVFLLLSQTALLGFLFLPQVHERYLYPFFPLLATYIGLTRKNITAYITISLLHCLNIYLVWHPMRLYFIPYQLMNNLYFQWLLSIGIVFTGLLLYVRALTDKVFHEKSI